VLAAPRLRVIGGGSKPALSSVPEGAAGLDLSHLAGIVAYEPGEFVFTALAATRAAEVEAMLAEHGQYLPFDPLLVDGGATLGGIIAANTSGPGRYRFGGVRDFLIGVRFVDGEGQLVRGGGKVVKNAAGFDFPKLMVGALGRLGALVELSFKVFPRPAAYATLVAAYPELVAALAARTRLSTSAFDLEALEIAIGDDGAQRLELRLGGPADVLPSRIDRLQAFLGADVGVEFRRLAGEEEASFWHERRELAWAPANGCLVKIPLTPALIPDLESRLAASAVRRRYSCGGNVAWLAWPEPGSGRAQAEALLGALNLAGMQVAGGAGEALLGRRPDAIFFSRVKGALDPAGRFQ
jgi:glycolate oxidase FAD binding subunit